MISGHASLWLIGGRGAPRNRPMATHNMIKERSGMARITMGVDRFGTEASEPEYRGLETGDILYFPISPPLLPEQDRAFLLTQRQVDASYHKNISYRPLEDRLKGVDSDDTAERKRVHEIMRG